MSIIVRNPLSGSKTHTDMKSVFENITLHTLNRMIVLDLPSNDTYIDLRNVKIITTNGNSNLAKIVVDDMTTDQMMIMREYYEYSVKIATQMGLHIDSFPESQKFVLKKKWYRAFNMNGSEILPSDGIIPVLKGLHYNKNEIRANIQVHMRTFRTHEGRILFQPLVRKINLI
jgi:hypothetical protein